MLFFVNIMVILVLLMILLVFFIDVIFQIFIIFDFEGPSSLLARVQYMFGLAHGQSQDLRIKGVKASH